MATSLELAITAIRSGRKEEGRQLLNLLIQQNPNDEMAWLWMSSVVNTDEQRARCLYHVLAINPNNTLARRGLELLGIVVTDSRPVQVPRDSQPIPIPKPSSAPMPLPTSLPGGPAEVKTGPLTGSAPERKPFRLDPKAITQELPFTPIREPFAEPMLPTPAVAALPNGQPSILAITEKLEQSLAAVTSDLPAAEPGPADSKPLAVNSEPAPGEVAPADHSTLPHPSEPVIPAQQGDNPAGPTGTMPLNSPDGTTYPAPPAGGSATDTRPSPPVQPPHANVTQGMPLPPPAPMPYPVDPAVHSSMTMGMPTVYVQSPNPWQPMPGFHSSATMGMPMAPVAPGMGYYAAPPYQQPLPANPAFYSNVTAAMPTLAPLDPRARPMPTYGQMLPSTADPRGVSRSGVAKRDEKEEGEEVNLLAVVIFGSLSVTALGGLGMLILLMFTGG